MSSMLWQKTAWWKLVITLITLVAFPLRLYGADRIVPWVPDTQIIRESLQLGMLLAGKGDLYDTGLSTFKYPLLLPYLLLSLYGLIFAAGYVSGAFPTIEAFSAFLFTHVTFVHLLAVVIVAIMGTLMVPLVYYLGKQLYKRSVGMFASLLTAFSLLLVQFSHQARPHVPVAFLLLLSFLCSLLVLRRRRLRYYVLAGLTSGLATITLQDGALAFLPLLVAHWGAGKASSRPFWQRVLDRRLALTLLIAFLIILLGYPQLLFAPDELLRMDRQAGGIYLSGEHPMGFHLFRGKGFAQIGRTLLGYEPVLTIFALTGTFHSLRSRQETKRLAFVALLPASYLLIFGLYDLTAPRFLCPIIPFLALMAGYGLETSARRITSALVSVFGRWTNCPPSQQFIAGTICTFLLLPSVVQVARLDFLLGQDDTRQIAKIWIETHLPTRAGIAIDTELGLVPTKDSLFRQQTQRPGSLGTKDQWLLRLPEEQYPEPSFAVTRLWVLSPSPGEDVGSFLSQNGIEYVVVTSHSAEPRNDGLCRFLTAQGRLLQQIHPAGWLTLFREANLRLDMNNAIIGLWTVKQPGPIIEIFQIGDSIRGP